MIGLLEVILDRKIKDLDYINTERLGLTIDEAKARFDLAVRFADGSTCVVEMQRAASRPDAGHGRARQLGRISQKPR